MNDQLSAQTATLSLKSGALLLPVLARSVATFGARADLSVDRIDRAVKLASLVASSRDSSQQLRAYFEFEQGRLTLYFEQPDGGQSERLLSDLLEAGLPAPTSDGEYLTFQV